MDDDFAVAARDTDRGAQPRARAQGREARPRRERILLWLLRPAAAARRRRGRRGWPSLDVEGGDLAAGRRVGALLAARSASPRR